VLVIAWLLVALTVGIWILFETFRIIAKIKTRKIKVLVHILLVGFFIFGSGVSIYLLVRDLRQGAPPRSNAEQQPPKLVPPPVTGPAPRIGMSVEHGGHAVIEGNEVTGDHDIGISVTDVKKTELTRNKVDDGKKPRPHYSPTEINNMLATLAELREFLGALEADRNKEILRLRDVAPKKSGPIGFRNPPPRPSESNQISDGLESYAKSLQAQTLEIQKILRKHPLLTAELASTVVDQEKISRDLYVAIYQVVPVLRRIAQISNDDISTSEFLAKPSGDLSDAYQAYMNWLSISIERIENKTAEIRQWQ